MGKHYDKLTSKQKIFVMEYMADLDKIRALKEAGYRGTNGSLQVMASKLLNKESIKNALAEIGNPIFEEQKLTVESLAGQLANYVYRDIGDVLNDDYTLKVPLSKIPPAVRQCIESVEVDNDYDRETGEITKQRIRVRLVSKIKSMELAMKYMNMLQPNTNININNNNLTINWDDLYAVSVNPNSVADRLQVMEDQIIDVVK